VLVGDHRGHRGGTDGRLDLVRLVGLLHHRLDHGLEDRPPPPDRADARGLVDGQVVELARADPVAVGHEALEPVQVVVEDLALLVVAFHLVVLAAVGHDVQARVGHVLDRQRHRVAVERTGLEIGELR
jgi:hypothetical protein